MIACIFRFFKGLRLSQCELGQVTLLHLEHGINLINLWQSGAPILLKCMYYINHYTATW